MRIDAAVCATLLLLCVEEAGWAQSMKVEAPPPPASAAVAPPAGRLTAPLQGPGRSSSSWSERPFAGSSATRAVRRRAEAASLIREMEASPSTGPSHDPVYDMLNAQPRPADDLLDRFRLLQEARAFVRSVTMYEGDRFTLLVDPLKPRCTVHIRLHRAAVDSTASR